MLEVHRILEFVKGRVILNYSHKNALAIKIFLGNELNLVLYREKLTLILYFRKRKNRVFKSIINKHKKIKEKLNNLQ